MQPYAELTSSAVRLTPGRRRPVERGGEVRYGALVSWYSWSDNERISIADLARSPADESPLVGHVTIPLPAEHRGASLVDEVVTIGDGGAWPEGSDAPLVHRRYSTGDGRSASGRQ